MDLEGLPVQLGPKPEVIKISAGAHGYQGGFGGEYTIDELTRRVKEKEEKGFYPESIAAELTLAEKIEMEAAAIRAVDKLESLTRDEPLPATPYPKVNQPTVVEPPVGAITMQDVPVFKQTPTLLGDNPGAQAVGFRALLDLVRHRDSKAFYKQFEIGDRALSFNEKVIIESRFFQERYLDTVKKQEIAKMTREAQAA